MSIFLSDRERRLWFWALIVVIAIYSTLGLAGQLVEEFRNTNLLGIFFAFGFLIVLVVILTQGLMVKPRGVEIAVGLGVAVVYFMVVVRMGVSAVERTHLFEYGVVAVLIYQALSERIRNGFEVKAPGVIAVLGTALLGWIDEGIQAILPDRVYDIRDVGGNAIAGLMAVMASLGLAWVRRRMKK
jgi:hypothetical protein